MLFTFSLRLACGLAWALLFLRPREINQRFFRVQFLTILGLIGLAAAASRGGMALWIGLGGMMLSAFAGAFAWSLDQAPGGRGLVWATAAASLGALSITCFSEPAAGESMVPRSA